MEVKFNKFGTRFRIKMPHGNVRITCRLPHDAAPRPRAVSHVEALPLENGTHRQAFVVKSNKAAFRCVVGDDVCDPKSWKEDPR